MSARPGPLSALSDFLAPRSIAVIGATEGVDKIGGRLMCNLLRHAYAGRLYPINRNRREVYGLKAYPDLAAVPGRVDLAIVSIPAADVLSTLEACAAAGVQSVVIASSGFADSGAPGAELQRQVAELGKRAGIRIAGPNTQGFYNVPAGIAATFSPAIDIEPGPKGPRKRIGIVAQSGGLGFSLYNRGRVEGLDFSTVVSVGNQCDLEIADYAEALLDDADTQLVMLFIEAIKAPQRFVALAARAAQLGKPLIVAKVGRHKAGQRAVISHTGSLAGSDTAYDAIFERYGVIRAESQEEMLEIAALFTRHKTPRGNRVAVLTATGGTGAWLADICEAHGLQVPEIDAEEQQRLKEVMPPYGSALNPIDITAQGLSGYVQTLALLTRSQKLDAVIVAISMAQELRLKREGAAIADLVRASEIPVLLFAYTHVAEASKALLQGWDLHFFTRMAGCARALQAVIDWHRFQNTARAAGNAKDPAVLPGSGAALRLLAGRGKILRAEEAHALLAAYGIGALPGRLAQDVGEAVTFAEEIGWPVALKVQSDRIPHKTDAKAVALDVADAVALRRAYADILARARAYAPGAEISGVLVQAMAKRGVELIAGVFGDAHFGPIVMCGLGGIHAEIFGDVAFAPAPLTQVQAEAMIDRLKAAKILSGYRGAAPADRRAFADLLVRLGRLAVDGRDRIAEIDLNPVIVYPEGQGLALVDALIVQKGGDS